MNNKYDICVINSIHLSCLIINNIFHRYAIRPYAFFKCLIMNNITYDQCTNITILNAYWLIPYDYKHFYYLLIDIVRIHMLCYDDICYLLGTNEYII